MTNFGTLTVLTILVARISKSSAFSRSCSSRLLRNSKSPSKISATETYHSRLFANVEADFNILAEKSEIDQSTSGKDNVRNWLICGDGDLSFSSSIAKKMAESGIDLVATVLEDRKAHQNVYQNSEKHQRSISSWQSHSVFFGVDATNLSSSFNNTKFDRIQFNFPHWRGKSNHRRNRELLDQFLKSASGSLSPDKGEIHVALCQGQGGATAKTLEEWRQSWMAAEYGGKHGLLLRNVIPFQPYYDLSSHRGADRGFRVGESPKLYIFDSKHGQPVPEQYRLCCRHELHIELPLDTVETPPFSRNDITDGDAILSLIESILPTGIRVEIPVRKVLEPSESGADRSIVIFLIVYCGESKSLTREEADRYRADAEDMVAKYIPLRANRAGRLVSRPFPYTLLDELLAGQVQRSLGNAR